MELKSPSIPLFPPGQRPKGETLMSLPFAAGQRGPLARRVMGGAAVQSQTMAPDAGEGFKKIILNS
jgi:hypothetical protein